MIYVHNGLRVKVNFEGLETVSCSQMYVRSACARICKGSEFRHRRVHKAVRFIALCPPRDCRVLNTRLFTCRVLRMHRLGGRIPEMWGVG